MGGFNLFRLKDLQITNSTAVYLNYAANSLDRYAEWLADPNFYTSKVIEDIQLNLNPSKLEIVRNPAHTTPNYDYSPNTTCRGQSQTNCQKPKCSSQT